MNAEEVKAYLKRIGYKGEIQRNEAAAEGLLRAHLTHVPFENLDVFDFGKVPCLDVPVLFEKIVTGNRGGYCFELNTLFGELLKALGFSVCQAAARVLWNREEIPPLTHMMLILELSGKKYSCDVGYGGPGPKGLLPLAEGEWTVAGEPFFVESVGQGIYRICRMAQGKWKPLLQLQDAPFPPQDFQLLNFYCAKNPSVLFTRERVVNLITETGSKSLMGMELSVRDGEVLNKTVYQDREELEQGLKEEFGICVSL